MGPFLASIALSFGLLAHLLKKGYALTSILFVDVGRGSRLDLLKLTSLYWAPVQRKCRERVQVGLEEVISCKDDKIKD